MNLVNPYILAPSLDYDAQAFITAAAITNPTQQGAIIQLVSDLKSNGLWARLKAIYPMVGGTAFSHKWNLKDPRDLDAAFRLVFDVSGTWTHSSTGANPSGNTFANTFLIPSTHLTNTSGSVTYYSREETNSGYDFGASDNGGALNLLGLSSRNYGNSYGAYGNVGLTCVVASASSIGVFMINRNDGTNTTLWKNGIKIKTAAEVSTLPSYPLYLGAISLGVGVNYWGNRECAFASIGGGFSDAESLTYYNVIQTFQTTLGR